MLIFLQVVQIYPMGYVLQLVIRTKGGKLLTVPVTLQDYRKFTNGDT